MKNGYIRRFLAIAAAAAACVGLASCGGSGGSSTANNKVIQFWDPYPQYKSGSDWAKFVDQCAPSGYTIKRQGMPQNDVLNNLTTAVKSDNAPEIAIIDNPLMPSAVDAALINDLGALSVKTTGFDKNIEGPGIVGGKQYGIAFGTNALGLYYNPTILAKAGVDATSIKDWNSLNTAIQKVVASGSRGITFSGITGEEGVFQFLPWFWGAGGDLSNIKGAATTDAQNLLAGWIKNGWAPKSATTDNQSASWDLFLTGQYGFSENGSWQAAAAKAKGYRVIPIPARNGGLAPVPTGGEFVTLPYHKKSNAAKQKAAISVVECLTSDANLLKTNETLGYLAAKASVRAKQVQQNTLWEPWIQSVENAKGRTTDVGLKYEAISSQLSSGEQAALNK